MDTVPATSKGIYSFPPCVWYRPLKVKPAEQIKDTCVINSNGCTFKWFELFSLQRQFLTLWFFFFKKDPFIFFWGVEITLKGVHLKKERCFMYSQTILDTPGTLCQLINSPLSHLIRPHSLKRNKLLLYKQVYLSLLELLCPDVYTRNSLSFHYDSCLPNGVLMHSFFPS